VTIKTLEKKNELVIDNAKAKKLLELC